MKFNAAFAFAAGLIVGIVALIFLQKTSVRTSKGLHFMTTHRFSSLKQRESLQKFVETQGHQKMAQLLTGDKAKCLISVQSKDYVLDYCIWKAESEEAVIDQLNVLKGYFEDVEIEAVQRPMFF